MRPTNAQEKLLASTINAAAVLLLSVPFLYVWGISLEWKVATTILFLCYSLFSVFFSNGRSIGMLLTDSYWDKPYPKINHIVHTVLYTCSFSTLFIRVWFPFDVLLINLLLFQLPFVIFTGTTLHAFLSGKMMTVRRLS